MKFLSVLLLANLALFKHIAIADSVVVFNEIMYHPPAETPTLEWIELHNQMAVDVDLSRWLIEGGIQFSFPEDTVIPGGGYLVVAASPAELAATTGLVNVLGPYTGRLSNGGEKLELRNNNTRLMDALNYGVAGVWPVAPDGSGVSLAKADEDHASNVAANWTVSALVGGTPGRRNFSLKPFETTNTSPIQVGSSWKYDTDGNDLGSIWRQPAFDDSAWASGQAPFMAGAAEPPPGDPQPIPSVFSSGVGPDGRALAPGTADPHYWLVQSAQSQPPPPSIAATVIQNHPAWLANSSLSSWVGPVNPGTVDVAAGIYRYATMFDLQDFDHTGAALTMRIAVDNSLQEVFVNGVAQGLSYEGFSSMSSRFSITNGFLPGANKIEFVAVNAGDTANPAGVLVELSGVARKQLVPNTRLPQAPVTSYFRKGFVVGARPELTALAVRAYVSDGAVFYLNGTEVLRLNMPAGPITATTLALSNSPSPSFAGPFAMPNAALVPGNNLLAVEIHSATAQTNDLIFAADLSLQTTNVLIPTPVPLAFNEISPATNTGSWIELLNYGSNSISLANFTVSLRGGVTNGDYSLPAQDLAPGSFLVLSSSALGFSPAPGDRFFLYGPGRQSVLDGVVAKPEPQARCPDGSGNWLSPSTLTPGESNRFYLHDEVVFNEIMYHAPVLPEVPESYHDSVLIGLTNTWKFQSLGLDLGSAWRQPQTDDGLWPSGSGLFYNTASVLPAPKNTELSLTAPDGTRIITWYFRTPFIFTGATNRAEFTLRSVLDDGAVYYVNGVEIFRQNMPVGPIGYGTFSSAGVATPSLSGPFSVTVSNLISGTNLFAVEVHQFTTNPIAADMTFGLELSAMGQLSPALPRRESPESWVELFNRGTNAVDLEGWRIDGDVEAYFGPGVSIPAGGYLVVPKDLAYMQSNYPNINVAGPFSGRLSQGGGHLVLRDAAGNPANEVSYLDAAPWPEYADGGGSTLELRDPRADNSRPEAWAASQPSTTGWSNYVYQGVAQNQLGATLWNEFVIGLLDAGECLLDDLHVVESPGTAPYELLQNGSFETGLSAWRALGNHGAARVEEDPDQPGNHVLHLIATGPTGHMHNHLETTLANGRSVVNGREYQVSFRAKWLAGNNRLNTRLYFNRLARTTALPMPEHLGSPGSANSVLTQNIGPTFSGLSHAPTVPSPSQPITIAVQAADPDGLAQISLQWRTDGGAWQSAPMVPSGASASPTSRKYSGTITGQSAGKLIQFYIKATDSRGALSAFPTKGVDSRALIRVDDGKPLMTQLHRLRLLVTEADAALLHAPTNVMSNERVKLTVLHDEREVFYDVGVHLQGSQRGRNDSSRRGFQLQFNADQLFRGVQDNIVIDRSGGYSGIGGKHEEILLWHAVNHAGGLLGLDCDIVQVFAPLAVDDGTGLLRMSAFDSDYFDNQFGDGGDGNSYKLELIYYPTTTTTGNPQAPKLPQPDDVINVDIQDRGTNQENYRWPFLQENNADLDDYSQAIALNQAFSLPVSSLQQRIKEVIDVDQWMRTLAFKAFTGDPDTFTYGLNHNWIMYFRPEDGRALGVLWDMDLCFLQSVNYSFPGTGSATTSRVTQLPDSYRRYYHHLYDLMTRTINSTHLAPWAKRYANLLGQNWSGVTSYLQQRADFVRSRMPATAPFAITSNGGQGFAVSTPYVTLVGTSPLSVQDIQINGVAYPLNWSSLSNWTMVVPLSGYSNLLSAQGLDDRGYQIPAVTDSIIVTNRVSPVLKPIVINEWMADNAGPGGFADSIDGAFSDWFELFNPNESAVDLSGYFLTDTVLDPVKWQIPNGTIISPRGFLMVWADNETDQNGLGTHGDLHVIFQLSRSGEAIALFGANGTLQNAVSFGSQDQNVSQGLFPDGEVGAIYSMDNWSPRAPNRLGVTPPPQISRYSLRPGGILALECQVLSGRTYRLEYKDDLTASNWMPLGSDTTAAEPLLIILDDIGAQPQRYYRLQLLK